MGSHALAEHRAVADAITAGDPVAATRAMARHLTLSSERVLAQMRTQ